MDRLRCRLWELEFDAEATRAAYAAKAASNPLRCDCSACRNFYAHGERAFCVEVLDLFAQLGIDWKYDVEAVHQYRDAASGLHCYVIWHHFVGGIISGPDLRIKQESPASGGDLYQLVYQPISDLFEIGFSRKADLIPDQFSGLEHFSYQLE